MATKYRLFTTFYAQNAEIVRQKNLPLDKRQEMKYNIAKITNKSAGGYDYAS
jgi:hypothetical protein